jgi:hypothetical protein
MDGELEKRRHGAIEAKALLALGQAYDTNLIQVGVAD